MLREYLEVSQNVVGLFKRYRWKKQKARVASDPLRRLRVKACFVQNIHG